MLRRIFYLLALNTKSVQWLTRLNFDQDVAELSPGLTMHAFCGGCDSDLRYDTIRDAILTCAQKLT